jgi:hypothetical protein
VSCSFRPINGYFVIGEQRFGRLPELFIVHVKC